jgi:hypothetical protein
MERHVNLVGLLHMLAGALTLLLAVSSLALGLGAAALISPQTDAASLAARATAAAFAVIAVLAFAWGAASLWAGAGLRRRHRWARLVALGLAVLDLFMIPFGTALGAYTVWVLVNERSRQLFEGAAIP